MSEVFVKHQEEPDSILESVNNDQIEQKDTKTIIKCLKELCRETRRQRKLTQKICQLYKVREKVIQEISIEQDLSPKKKGRASARRDSDKKKRLEVEEKSFLNRLGDAFLKALPNILRTVASAAVTATLGFISKWSGMRKRVV